MALSPASSSNHSIADVFSLVLVNPETREQAYAEVNKFLGTD
ncbi:MAG: hypothetical protein ACI9R3_006537 [Verrucomicrobiales bacterium]|jgi:hypothetical protein